jgi:hypothetical protein
MGLCPIFAEVGDYICVALGCNSSLILHPLPGSTEFRLRGDCYTHGLMRGEALLGRLPEPWKLRMLETPKSDFPFYCNDGNVVTQRDPRLPPLPFGWRELYGWDIDNVYGHEHDDDGEPMDIWFENISTKEIVRYDPRLTSEALKARGVDIKEFTVV